MVRLFPSLASEYSLTLTHTHTHRYMRGLPHNKTKLANDDESFRRALRWDSRVDGKWLDRDRLSLLMYAVVNNNESIVRDVVKKLRGNHDDEDYKRHIDSRIRDQGFVELGIPGKTTILFAAISKTLLFVDTNSIKTNIRYGGVYGRAENLKCWLKHFPNWNLEHRNTKIGGQALGITLYMGPNKYETFKVLLKAGARIDTITHTGVSNLIAACSNEDADPQVIQHLLTRMSRKEVNYRLRPQTSKWKLIRLSAKILYRFGLVKSTIVKRLALGAGLTALHYAARRGDVDVVKMLLSAGADPRITNDFANSARHVVDFVGDVVDVVR